MAAAAASPSVVLRPALSASTSPLATRQVAGSPTKTLAGLRAPSSSPAPRSSSWSAKAVEAAAHACATGTRGGGLGHACGQRGQREASMMAAPGSTTMGWRRAARGAGAVSYTHLTLPTICSV
eukprot:1828422-Rhodomonas_salina.2